MTFSNGNKTRLDSWKAVSVYFGRDERTVRRWEAERGLPIHRLPGHKRSQIYAEVSELDSWLHSAEFERATRESERTPEKPPGAATHHTRDARRSASSRHARRRRPSSAQQLCVEGEAAWGQRTPASLNQALDAFNAAVRIDPTFAEAHVGLAKTYILLREFTLMPDAQAYPMARSAARRALALDDTLALAHAAAAFVDFWGFWDAAAARQGFGRAIALDPVSATARHWCATFLNAQADHAAAVREIDFALALDPTSVAIRADRGQLLFHAGRQHEAVAALRDVAAADPTFQSPQKYLAALYLVTGQDRDYLRQAESLAAMTRDRADAVAQVAARVGYEAAGRRGMLAALLADRVERARAGAASAYSVARLHAMSGNEPSALLWLQKSLDKRETDFVYVVFDAAFAAIRAAEPLQAFVAQVQPFA